ncbi:MAG: DNA polymerase I [Bacteroidales bacterium]|nr:DNA polymerase I [Bacteroidales bacterium]
MKTLYLIDGHALIFKMFYAFERTPMYNAAGENTSILYGFTKYIFELMEACHPTHIAIGFDPPCKTFRHELFPDYKGTRKETPELVRQALDPLCEIADALNIPVIMKPGFEADDVISSTAIKAAEEGYTVYMVTPDKDYAQIVRPGIFQLRPGKGGSSSEVLGPAEICEKYGLDSPSQMIDYLTICGDSSDNVEGVAGVGPVGAAKLLKEFGSVENIYEHIDEIKGALKDKFLAAKDHIELSKTLVTIRTDVPTDISFDEMEIGAFKSKAESLFDKYQFNSLKKYLGGGSKERKTYDEVALKDFKWQKNIAINVVRDNIFLANDNYQVTKTDSQAIKPLLNDELIHWVGYDLKQVVKDVEIKGPLEDISIIHYLIDSEASNIFQDLCVKYLGEEATTGEEEEAPESLLFDMDAEEKNVDADSLHTASLLMDIFGAMEPEYKKVEKLYKNIEEPLIRVLAEMEKTGVKVDMDHLQDYIQSLKSEVAFHEAEVKRYAGDENLNVGSPKQIGELIFEKLALDPNIKPTKTKRYSYSTDEETLTALRETHPIIDEILEFRSCKKLLSTYIEPIPSYLVDGKVHTSFNQSTTATGRLSSSKPNLQNIPIRTPRGSQIRSAFVASDPEGCILSADYSQIELRILAHCCEDEHLINAFTHDVDIHKATAAKIFGINEAEVTSDQRRIAKTANFGILYGISAFGLATRLKISRAEAKKIIEDYFNSFPTVRQYIDSQISLAREKGYVETLYGRKRYLREINSSNAQRRAFSERNAVNAPIQGTSADIIKIAMINIQEAIKTRNLKSRMVLQIHDELVFDVAPGERENLEKLVVEIMENVTELKVPLKVECGYGKSWLEAH